VQRSRPQRCEGGTQHSIITLTGHVRTWAGHGAVVSVGWMANGVIDVRDELQVTG
jgi:osmotically-inducible protein OsmY